jgi:hypothetical protein
VEVLPLAHALPQAQTPTIATSMMAAMYGAVRTWDDSVTLTDLFGYSGHAFILNIERTLCPSGPTAWDWGAILFPLRQLFSLKRICATCDMRDVDEARELIWARATTSIDAGRPVILWDAVLPEFYLANGYDAATGEYLVEGPGAEHTGGRVSHMQLGQTTGRVWALFPAPHDSPDRDSARDLALRGAVMWHRWPNDRDAQWTFGGDAWDVWITAMREEEVPLLAPDVSLNQQVYGECRRHAAAFTAGLGVPFAEAAGHYLAVAAALDAVCALWPFPAPVPPLAVRQQVAEHLVTAKDAEGNAVRALDAALADLRTGRARR